MGTPFTRAALLARFGAQVGAGLEMQRADGAYLRPDWGIDDPGGTASLVAQWLVAAELGVGPAPDVLLDAAERGMDYLLAYQRESGLTDLRDCNYDSSPDAGFILQAVVPALTLAPHGPARTKLETFTRRMVVGAMAGGFHTPNHRWVIASGLAQTAKVLDGLDVRETVDAYLAEGFDLDPDGFYLERSAGVYDAICDRSLLLLADAYDYPPARDAALTNLRANLFLLNADGSVETGLSRRQDYGSRAVPAGLIAPYLLGYVASCDAELLAAAELLWEKSGGGDAYGALLVVLAHGEPPESGSRVPSDFSHRFAHNGLWRLRRGERTLSVFSGVTRLLDLRHGKAHLASLKISQSYFGVGRFVADRMVSLDGGVRLESDGRGNPLRPGYEQPLGRPVPYDAYAATRAERVVRRVPDCAATLEIVEADGGIDLRFVSTTAMDRVPVQLAFDFPPGGIWESGDVSFEPRAGQVIFLKAGRGAMRYGRDVLAIGPGADFHRMVAMRDAEGAPDHVRILVTLMTPAEHALEIRTYRRDL